MSDSKRIDQIVGAVAQIVARDGAHAVSMRAVAAEAGVSLRLVQYYGNTKQELLATALSRLSERSVQHWRDSLINADNDGRQALQAFFIAALPLDEEREAFHRFGVSLEQLAISNLGDFRNIYTEHLNHLAALIAPHLTAATDRTDPDLAYEFLALAHGLGSLVMTGALTEAQAHSRITEYLSRLTTQQGGQQR